MTDTPMRDRSIAELVTIAKNNWCGHTHGHGMLPEQVAAIDELARRAALSVTS